jgi:acyl carrier protein
MDIEAAIKKIVSEHLDIEYDAVRGSFMDDLGADSLDTVELVMQIEEEFDIEIPDEDSELLKTVEQLVTYLKNNT